MPPTEFKPTIQAIQRPQTYALDSAATAYDEIVSHLNPSYAPYLAG